MINPDLYDAFKYWRAPRLSANGRSRRFDARSAIVDARRDVAAGKKRYPSEGKGIGEPYQSGSTALRWIEEPSAFGLRFVGYADEISRAHHSRSIDHTGWFTTDDGWSGEKMRGVVFQLPGKNGQARFVAGYDNECNGAADNGGPCAISFDEIFIGDGEDHGCNSGRDEGAMEAARRADSIAEYAAELERDYQRASSARIQFDELADDIALERKQIIGLCAERREARAIGANFATICETIRKEVRRAYRAIQRNRAKRAELESQFGRCEGWQS